LEGAGILSWRRYAVFEAGIEIIAIGKVFLLALFSFLLLLDTSLPLLLYLSAFMALLLPFALTPQNINRYLPTKAGPLSNKFKNI
jgi:hypothetical protein